MSTAVSFDRFTDLPPELRRAIWRLCIPSRICELDTPDSMLIYDTDDEKSPVPCKLWQSTVINASPPAVTRVCRESRGIALETGGPPSVDAQHVPIDDRWASNTVPPWIHAWEDQSRDSAHLYWDLDYECDFQAGTFSDVASVCWLAFWARRLRRPASIMLGRLNSRVEWDTPIEDDEQPDTDDVNDGQLEYIRAFKRIPEYLVIMQIIVVHTDFKTGAATELFGLLGDAPVQIVDMADASRVAEFFQLAEECERRSPVSVSQDFQRRPLALGKQKLKNAVLAGLRSEELLGRMRPAYMFRLCTLMCNHIHRDAQ